MQKSHESIVPESIVPLRELTNAQRLQQLMEINTDRQLLVLDRSDPRLMEAARQSDDTALRAILSEQNGGSHIEDFTFSMVWRVLSQNFGPGAVMYEDGSGQNICIVNAPEISLEQIIQGLFRTRDDLSAHIVRTSPFNDPERLAAIVYLHESQHCNQPESLSNRSKLDTVRREVDADRAAIVYIRNNMTEEHARAYIDYRMLAASSDQDHATALFLDRYPDRLPDENYMEAVGEFERRLHAEMRKLTDHDYMPALQTDNPQEYLRLARQVVESGVLTSGYPQTSTQVNRYIQELSELHADAFQRVVVDTGYAPGLDKSGVKLVVGNDPAVLDIRALSFPQAIDLGGAFQSALISQAIESAEEKSPAREDFENVQQAPRVSLAPVV